jgi:hypothetical protein
LELVPGREKREPKFDAGGGGTAEKLPADCLFALLGLDPTLNPEKRLEFIIKFQNTRYTTVNKSFLSKLSWLSKPSSEGPKG